MNTVVKNQIFNVNDRFVEVVWIDQGGVRGFGWVAGSYHPDECRVYMFKDSVQHLADSFMLSFEDMAKLVLAHELGHVADRHLDIDFYHNLLSRKEEVQELYKVLCFGRVEEWQFLRLMDLIHEVEMMTLSIEKKAWIFGCSFVDGRLKAAYDIFNRKNYKSYLLEFRDMQKHVKKVYKAKVGWFKYMITMLKK